MPEVATVAVLVDAAKRVMDIVTISALIIAVINVREHVTAIAWELVVANVAGTAPQLVHQNVEVIVLSPVKMDVIDFVAKHVRVLAIIHVLLDVKYSVGMIVRGLAVAAITHVPSFAEVIARLHAEM